MQCLIYLFKKSIELVDVNINKYKALHEQERIHRPRMGFIEYSFSTHPTTRKRIARLEELLITQ